MLYSCLMLKKGDVFEFYYVQELVDGRPLGVRHIIRATDCSKAVVVGTKYAVSVGWLYFSVYDKFDKSIFNGKITF